MNTKLATEDFEFISHLVRVEAAILLEKGKEYLVESRLEPLAKSLDFQDITSLVARIRNSREKGLVRNVVECLTTHETSFFRDIAPFEALRDTVLPGLIERNRGRKELTIWCGAASSGQEPYSLCMLIREHFPELLGWNIKFFASDISIAILNRARSGIYSQIEVNRGLPLKLLVKYFEKNGQDWCLRPEIKGMVTFFEQNLLHPFVRVSAVDLMMLRNVLIYFDIETKRQILARVRKVMKPDGYLFLGSAETTINIDDKFERTAIGKTSCYSPKQ